MRTPSLTDNKLMPIDFTKAKLILSNINWSFSTSSVSARSDYHLFDGRRHHWYPATFIPEIPYSLIDVLTHEGDVIYDPFMGIGTTIFQALVLGRRPYASEICRVAVNIVQAMLTLLMPATDISQIEKRIQMMRKQYDAGINYAERFTNKSAKTGFLQYWFSKETFNQIMYLVYCKEQEADMGCHYAMHIALSATLKAVCAQDKGWGCIADNMLPKPNQLDKDRSTFDRFARNVNILVKDVIATRKMLPVSARQFLDNSDLGHHVIVADARQSKHVTPASVDLIVTSPPYPNMTDYSTSQRLSYYLLGFDPLDDISSEIGARRKRFSSTSVLQYVTDMKAALENSCTKLKSGGYACFVMPNFDADKTNNISRRHAVQECLTHLRFIGMEHVHELTRVLPTKHRQHNHKWATLERESISIYRKA